MKARCSNGLPYVSAHFEQRAFTNRRDSGLSTGTVDQLCFSSEIRRALSQTPYSGLGNVAVKVFVLSGNLLEAPDDCPKKVFLDRRPVGQLCAGRSRG